jgi:hypothetical protein
VCADDCVGDGEGRGRRERDEKGETVYMEFHVNPDLSLCVCVVQQSRHELICSWFLPGLLPEEVTLLGWSKELTSRLMAADKSTVEQG